MQINNDFDIRRLMNELDAAVLAGDVNRADELTEILYRIQIGEEENSGMPFDFPAVIAAANKTYSGGRKVKSKSFKRIMSLGAAAALIVALGITAMATDLFGIRDMVFGSYSDPRNIGPETAAPTGDIVVEEPEENDLIIMQGYPDSNEYKACEEWNIFCENYDKDGSVLASVGNSSNEYTENYPMYLVYSKDMADKLEEIIAKYGLTLHQTMTIVQNSDELITTAGTGDFLRNAGNEFEDTVLGGYVYNDGSFQYDGNLILDSGASVGYQFGRYVKGTFSSTYLNVGDADSYDEWEYTTVSGVKVNLALGNDKSLIIADLGSSFVTVNILDGTGGNDTFSSGVLTKDSLQEFADAFDFSQID
jgi:hypothetical protein